MRNKVEMSETASELLQSLKHGSESVLKTQVKQLRDHNNKKTHVSTNIKFQRLLPYIQLELLTTCLTICFDINVLVSFSTPLQCDQRTMIHIIGCNIFPQL